MKDIQDYIDELEDLAWEHSDSYENELYNKHLKGWIKEYKNTTAENSVKRVEVIYMNYDYREKKQCINFLN